MEDQREATRDALMALLSGTPTSPVAPQLPPSSGNDLMSLLLNSNAPSGRPAALPPIAPASLERTSSGGVADLLSSVLGAASPLVASQRTGGGPVATSEGPSLLSLLNGGQNLPAAQPSPESNAVERTVSPPQLPSEPAPVSSTTQAPKNLSTPLFTYVDPFLEARMSEQEEEALGGNDGVEEHSAVEVADEQQAQLAESSTLEAASAEEPSTMKESSTMEAVSAEEPSTTEETKEEITSEVIGTPRMSSPLPVTKTESALDLVVTPEASPALPSREKDDMSPENIRDLLHSPALSSPTPRSPTPSGSSSGFSQAIKAAVAGAVKAAAFREASGVEANGAASGFRLPSDRNILFNVRESLEAGINSGDLAEEKVALMANELDFKTGRIVAGNSSYIAYAVRGGKVRIIDMESGARDMVSSLGSSVVDMAMCQAVNRLAVIGDHSRLLVIDLPPLAEAAAIDGEEPASDKESGIPSQVSVEIIGRVSGRFVRTMFDQTGEWLVAAGSKGEVWLWNTKELLSRASSEQDGRRVFSEEDEDDLPGVIAVYESDVVDFAFAPDSSLLATISANGIVRLFRLPDLRLMSEIDEVSEEETGSFVEFFANPVDDSSLTLLLGWDMNRTVASCKVLRGRLDKVQRIKFVDERQEVFFNTLGFDPRTSSLFVGSVLRSSIIIVKMDEQGDFEYMREYPVANPVVSLSLIHKAEETEEETSTTLLTAQTKSIAQHQWSGWGSSEVLIEQQRQKTPMFAATEPLTAARRARSRSRSRSRSLTSNTPVSKTPVRAASPLGASVSFESAVAEAGLEGAISADVAEAIMESEDLTPAEVEQGTGRVVLGKISSPVLSILEGALASPRPASAGAAPRSTANVGTRELQKLEENLSRKFEQLMKQEQQRTQNLFERERLRGRAEESGRQEQLIKAVASTLTLTVSRQLDSIVAREIESKAIPALLAAMKDVVQPKVDQQLKESLSVAVQSVTKDPAFVKMVSEQVLANVTASMKSAVSETLAPTMQRLIAATLSQVNTALQTGVGEVTQAAISAVHTASSPGAISNTNHLADIEHSFTQALAAQNPAAIAQLLRHFDPQAAMSNHRLSQPVILSLLQFLAQSNLLEDTQTKVSWLQASIQALEPNDPTISAHVPRIIAGVSNSLQAAARAMYTSGHPLTSTINSLAITVQGIAR